MIQNTPENKARFFALYWKQPVVRSKIDTGWGIVDIPVMCDLILHSNSYYLELRPLSDITDEEAIEIAKMTFTAPELITAENGREDLRIWCEFSGERPYRFVYNSNKTDYLRSRGFALPYMGVSVETLIEWGWVKLKGGAAE